MSPDPTSRLERSRGGEPEAVHPGPWRTLRGRAALSFAVLTLVLATTMAAAVLATVSGFLVLERERNATTRAAANAEQVFKALTQGGLEPPKAIAQLPREIGAVSLIAADREWFTTSLDVGRADLPEALRAAVLDGEPSRQRIVVDDATMLAVGVPLPDGDAYFAVLPLHELNRALSVLGVALAVAVVVVSLAALGLGWRFARPALRPLTELSDAAAAIARGDVTARIDPRGDPELTPLAESFNTTAAALERRLRADERFAGDVAHELRSPLTTMLTAVSVLTRHRRHLPDDGPEALDLLEAEVHRFSRLVQDLLEISRSGADEAALAEVVLAELVQRAVPEQLRRRVTVQAEAAHVRVHADKRRLERVLVNLVENAEVHGGGLTAVTVSTADGLARIDVDDAGPGVREADRSRIFERFSRGAGSGRHAGDGVGLGLALATEHLRLHGGQLWVEDSPHGGARFVVTLPLCRGTPE